MNIAENDLVKKIKQTASKLRKSNFFVWKSDNGASDSAQK